MIPVLGLRTLDHSEHLRWLVWICGILALVWLSFVIRNALVDPALSRPSRVIRIIGAGIWALLLITGMLLRIFGSKIGPFQ